MQILLIQIDGKLPNLALMKIAAYHRNMGDEVIVERGVTKSSRLFSPDKVYISCIFKNNCHDAIDVSTQFPHSEVRLGGSGINFNNQLPTEIEHLMPYYDIFGCSYSVGFTTRGCIRYCDFCIVPQKEGKIRVNANIYEFWDRRHKHIVLLDNNILALPNHFETVCNDIRSEKITVDFNQGLDIRLINEDNAYILSKLKISPHLRFSWDNIKDENIILRGIHILKAAGINRSSFFVLSGWNSTFNEDLYRLEKLKAWNQRAYLMRHTSVRGIHKYNNLAAWANQPWLFAKMTFDEFQKIRDNRKPRPLGRGS